jgi:tetratricopeptide (TPR) repeat protein
LRDASPQTWVFWIHASNAARYNEGVRDCLKLANVDKGSDLNENIHVLFRDWLRSEDSGRWLIVIDNADEIDFLVERSNNEKSMFKQLPVCDHGTVLITSRSRVSASKLVQPKEMIEIPPMREQQAVDLIEGRLGKDEDSAKLAAALDYMPLAISQAAAYIEQRGKRFSMQRYIEKIQKGDLSRKSILDENVEDLRRDEEARNAITLTWEISFEHIRRLRRSAADLLSLMSFFDRQAIPEVLLRVQRPPSQAKKTSNKDQNRANRSGGGDSGSSSGDESDAAQDDSFDKDVVMLKGFAFISTTTAEDSTFEMHRLVQRATQRWLQSQKQFDTWRAEFLYNLSDVYPNGDFENWKVCQRLYPHVKLAVEMKPANKNEEFDQALICRRAGWYAFNMYWLREAEDMLAKGYEIFNRTRGEKDPETLHSAGCLAILYDILGRFTEAEKLQTKILAERMSLLGPDHPTTLVDMHNLAYSYKSQGRKDEAEQLFTKVIEAKTKNLGSEHEQTLHSMHGLALTYLSQGRLKEAEELLAKVVEARVRVLGSGHKDTLLSIARLSDVYFETKQWDKAEELMTRVIQGYEGLHGAQDPKTLKEFAFLAKVYHESGQYGKAEELRLRTIQAYEALYGPNDSNTLEEVAFLARLYYESGQKDKAEPLRLRTLQEYERIYGANDPKTLIQGVCLADIYFDSRQYTKAEDLMVQVVQGHEHAFGAQSPKTLQEVAFLAKVYYTSGKYAKAEELRLRTIKGYEQLYGAQDQKTLAQRACLADVYYSSRRYAAAEGVMVRVVQGYEKALGAQDPKTLLEVDFLAKVRRAREEADPDGAPGRERLADRGSRDGQSSTDPRGSQSMDEQDPGSDEASYTLDRDQIAHQSPRDHRDSSTVSRSWRRRIRARFGPKRPAAKRP